ncbi:hypothetical protein SA87_06835 [Hydrogenibacillus schlegelii]|uniref:Metallo-beta-lactamase domain-containing protein n=1 Tax=Hydrogenibacillus schlegelii TaxID=1484 RepID=A0A179IND8_HYDSH|nr:hypothetical protein SA87_06835 [Hydrogenibacillus schlegelii]
MTVRYSILASGSSGNAFYLEGGGMRFLVDAGVSARRIQAALGAFGVTLTALDGIWISHEHDDHVRGLWTLLKRAPVPLFMNPKTYAALSPRLEALRAEGAPFRLHLFPSGTRHRFRGLDVTTFSVSHDAADPMMFHFAEVGGPSLALVTDLGVVPDRVKAVIEGADAYVFEANHDAALLWGGRYPWPIKRRIASPVGHLSNEEAARALADVVGPATQRIHLAHLSRENNRPDLALRAVGEMLARRGRHARPEAILDIARPDVPSPLFPLERSVACAGRLPAGGNGHTG